MNTNIISLQSFGNKYQGTARKLIPISQYKGPLLKLTSDDMQQINRINEQIKNLEIEHYNLSKYIAFAKRITRSTLEKLYELEISIESLRAQVKDVKVQRFRLQSS